MGCNTGSNSGSRDERRRRRNRHKDDLLEQLGLSAKAYTFSFGEDVGEGAEERIKELEDQVLTMSKTMLALAERVQVLERIVVDDEANLTREFDRLRNSGRQD